MIKIYLVVGMLFFDLVFIVNCLFWLFYYIISDVVFVGGGSNFMFGEIFLVYYGVLFLDELFEFKWMVLEVLWQLMEEWCVIIFWVCMMVDYLVNFMLVVFMNFCLCGYYNYLDKECVCGLVQINWYFNKIFGLLLDWIDLYVEVMLVFYDELVSKEMLVELSSEIMVWVIKVREIQVECYKDVLGVNVNV